MNYSEQANLQRQKIDWWLPRAGEMMVMESLLMGTEFLRGVCVCDKNGLKLDYGDDSTTL